ncbi:hypothetical protein Dimus_030617, partial [Dionaea muscipula]
MIVARSMEQLQMNHAAGRTGYICMLAGRQHTFTARMGSIITTSWPLAGRPQRRCSLVATSASRLLAGEAAARSCWLPVMSLAAPLLAEKTVAARQGKAAARQLLFEVLLQCKVTGSKGSTSSWP